MDTREKIHEKELVKEKGLWSKQRKKMQVHRLKKSLPEIPYWGRISS